MNAPSKRMIAEKYEVLGVLGEGGTGIVYDAVRVADGKAVALKVMHDALAGDNQIRGRFQREAAILRRLDGVHVCPILELGEVPGPDGKSLLYIALPKIEGDSLADVLAKEPMEVGRALDIMLQVLAALTSAHAEGVVHRDLKPANVLLEGGTKVVVVDFGMSKIVTGAGMGTTNLTAHNMVFGTPEYMSPEQARGDDLDARCDVYAAGIMLYEMLTGGPPFTGPTPLSILTAHLTSELEPPSKRPGAAGRVTPALEIVVINALARDRDERYESANAFAAAIEHAREAPANLVSLRPGSSTARTDAFASTLPAALLDDRAVDVTAPTLVGNHTLASTPPRISAKPSRPPESTPSRAPQVLEPRRMPDSGTGTWVIVWLVVGFASIAAGVYFALRR